MCYNGLYQVTSFYPYSIWTSTKYYRLARLVRCQTPAPWHDHITSNLQGTRKPSNQSPKPYNYQTNLTQMHQRSCEETAYFTNPVRICCNNLGPLWWGPINSIWLINVEQLDGLWETIVVQAVFPAWYLPYNGLHYNTGTYITVL